MNVFLSGATGFLGRELLFNLAGRDEIAKIFCFVRSSSRNRAILSGIKEQLEFHRGCHAGNKIATIEGDLLDEGLPQTLGSNKALLETDMIIHAAANTSFSRINDQLIDRVNINGLENLLQWAEQLPHLRTFLHISTASVCGMNSTGRLIYEHESPNPHASHLVRYTYSKMKAELLLDSYLPIEKILIARPSIIVGDSRPLMPRSNEISRAIAIINQLRLLPLDEHAMLDMIPVDYAAASIIDLAFTKRQHRVYHISGGIKGATSTHRLCASLEAYFKEMPAFRFLDKSMIEEVKLWSNEKLYAGSRLYDHSNYLDHWINTFKDLKTIRVLFTTLEPYIEFVSLGLAFDNSRLLEDVQSARQSIPADIYIKNCIELMEKEFCGRIWPDTHYSKDKKSSHVPL